MRERFLSRVDATEILPGLYQGGEPPEGFTLQQAGFGALCLCAKEVQGGSYPGVIVVRCPLDDEGEGDLEGDAFDRAQATAERLAHLWRKGPVLVTCYEGRNRSGLITALTLRELTGDSGAKCIQRIRERRNPDLRRLNREGALMNPTFERALRALP